MSKRSYYLRWLQIAFRRPFAIAEGIAFFLAVVAGLIVWQQPSLAGEMTILLWLIPLSVFAATLLVGLIIAPYTIHNELEIRMAKTEKERDSLSKRLENNDVMVRGRQELAALYDEGEHLRHRMLTDPWDYDFFNNAFIAWNTQVRDRLAVLGKANLAAIFGASTPLPPVQVRDDGNPRRQLLINVMFQRLERLQEILRQL